MNKISKRNVFFVGLMIFSMFFGAGNLIFPPFLGQMAGKNTLVAYLGFIVSAVGLPVLSVIVVSKSNGLNALASHIHPMFALIFTILIYLSIGPFLAIPRTATVSYEMGALPFLPKSLTNGAAPLLIYTIIYFLITLWLSLTPSKLVDRLGKILTPILLILIIIVFAASFFKPMGSFQVARGDYKIFPFFKGFSEGYLTMDAIAGLNFGIVICTTLKSMGVKKEKSIVTYTTEIGAVVGVLLASIYAMLSYLGASSAVISKNAQNGAEILTSISLFLFGKFGVVIMGIIFTLACLTTAVGLITSCSEYFASLTNKISYKSWVFILSAASMIFSNAGLTKILEISVPVLNAIYPMAIVLMLLFMFNRLFKDSKHVYRMCMLFTAIFSIVDAVNVSFFKVKAVSSIFSSIPFYSVGLGWVIPALSGILLGCIFSAIDSSKKEC